MTEISPILFLSTSLALTLLTLIAIRDAYKGNGLRAIAIGILFLLSYIAVVLWWVMEISHV